MNTGHQHDPGTVREQVRARYAAAAGAVSGQGGCGCGQPAGCGCDGDCCVSSQDGDPGFGAGLYPTQDRESLPDAAVLASLGCGNPTAVAELQPGETVLDLGSGGGIDVLISAKHVGPTGKVYGLDMTDEMLALARGNQRRAGVTNVEFLKGAIEAIPLPDRSVDVIISNCVINLSVDKDAALREAFRVLKPGGRFAVSDVVIRGEVPADVRRSLELWVGCVAGALRDDEYAAKLETAGFEDVDVETWRVYQLEDARGFLAESGIDVDRLAPEVDGKLASAFIRARRPEARSCCGPTCCS